MELHHILQRFDKINKQKKGDSLRNPISNGRSRWIPIKLADKKRVVEGQGYPQPSFSIKILGTS